MTALLRRRLLEEPVVVLYPRDLAVAEESLVEAILDRRACAVAIGSGLLRGMSLAVALECDWFAASEECTVQVDSAQAWAAVATRVGSDAYRLHLLEGDAFAAPRAQQLGIVDALVPADVEPESWLARWMRGRSAAALQSAAMLLRSRGGDRLERAEFAKLFAAGEPQIGLRAFLEKRTPRWPS